MIHYLLDTNAVISLLNDRTSKLARWVQKQRPGEVCISSIVAHELYFGAFKSKRREANLELIDKLPLEVLEFDKEDARTAGEIRADLAIAGTPIGPLDVLIAGQAVSRDLWLITNNQREFARVRNLRIAKL